MNSDFIRTINEHNLCTCYILPLIGLNKFSFEEANFIDNYITRDGKIIAVEVVDFNLCFEVRLNKHFVERKQKEYSEFLIFQIPDAWLEDVACYMRGEYSKLTEYAKELIRENSGLKYNVTDEQGNKRTMLCYWRWRNIVFLKSVGQKNSIYIYVTWKGVNYYHLPLQTVI